MSAASEGEASSDGPLRVMEVLKTNSPTRGWSPSEKYLTAIWLAAPGFAPESKINTFPAIHE